MSECLNFFQLCPALRCKNHSTGQIKTVQTMALPPAFVRHGPALPAFPVVVAVPHAGRHYPSELLASAAVSEAKLQQLEDRHADALVTGIAAAGATVIVANRARAWIDLNRAPEEVDPGMLTGAAFPGAIITARTRSGLGLIPRRIGNGPELVRGKLTRDSVRLRIECDHHPYHQAISDALAAARDRFGIAVLLDCHSMPPLRPDAAGDRPLVVVGNRYGHSAAHSIVECVEATVQAHGLPVSRNAPYAGGYSLDQHGKPETGIHALQVEIDRSLYLDEALDAPGAGLGAMQVLLSATFDALVKRAALLAQPPFPQPIAAE